MRRNISKILFILFSLFAMNHLLLARDALPVLVEGGEPFESRDDFYIPTHRAVNAVAISLDGKIIVSGSSDQTIEIWNKATGVLEQTLEGHEKSVTSVAISKDGKTIISGSDDTTIKIWNRATGVLEQTLEGHEKSVTSVAISKDGKTIISGSDDKTIKIWNRATGALEQTLKGHKGKVSSVDISKDGKTIISGSDDKTIKIWNRATGVLEQTLEGHKGGVTSVVISKDGKTIVSGSYTTNSLITDRTIEIIKIWNRVTGELEQTLEGHKGRISSVAISKNGKNIISGSEDGTIKIWNRITGELKQTLEGRHKYSVKVVISEDGTIISGSSDRYTYYGTIKIWNRATRELEQILGRHRGWVSSSRSKDGKTIITGLSDGTIKIWNRTTGVLEQTIEGHEGRVSSVDISEDGTTIISGSKSIFSDDKTIKIWNKATGVLEQTLEGHEKSVTSIAISKDGKTIISGSDDTTIKIWNRATGVLEQTLEGHKDGVTSVVISEDGKTIISGSYDKTIKIWNKATGALEHTLEGHEKSVTSVAISKDGKTIISSSPDKTIKIWNIKTDKLIKTLQKKNRIIFAMDSHFNFISFKSKDNIVRFWNESTGKRVENLKGYKSFINNIIIDSDSKSIIVNSFLLDVKSGKIVKEYIGGRNGTWITFDYKNKKLYRGDDGTLLYKKSKSKIRPIYPQKYNLSQLDDFNLSINKKNIEIPNNRIIELNLSIENQLDTSYFLTITGEGKYLSVKDKKVSKIKKGEIKTIPLKIYAKLPQNNPKPTMSELNITVITGNGTTFMKSVPIKISYASIEVAKAKLSEDKKILNMNIQNIGNVPLKNARVQLNAPFTSNIQNIDLIEANSSEPISFVVDSNFSAKSIGLSLLVPNTKLQQENPKSKVAPLAKWQIDNITVSLNKMAWYLYALMLLAGLFLLWSVWYYRRYKNPLVVKLQNNPKNLLTLNPKLLEEAEQRLSTINQWQTVLKSSDVSQKQFDETTTFFKSTSKDRAKLIAKRLGAECYQDGEFFRVNMPKSFDLNIDTFLLYFPKEELKKEILDEHDKVLVIANEAHQKETHKLATDRTNRLIAPTEQKLTEFLLSSESERVLIDIFAECLLFKDISPYQVNSGVNNESNFFGRVEIIRDIITKENANYLIVGARQLGKSSIIKALERRYDGSSKVECYSFTMEDENIVLAMSRALGMEGEPTLDEVVSTIANAPKKSIFLIDEADRFVKHEKEVDYEVTEAFRKLSQEGKATFVLTGFWTLYFAVTSDYHSPLKNFGELIKLEGLDHNSCRDLMIEPMKRIGVSYESESIVENVIEFCGRRPNLIAITCNEVLKKLEGKVITQANIDEVVENSSLEDYLKGWGSMSENEADNRLDRVIIYLTLEKESFRLADIDAWLKEQGKKIDANRIKSSLERLVVGYILKERKKNYSYRVPLFREKLLEDDIEILLDGDLEGL